jgi:hypothetical protein
MTIREAPIMIINGKEPFEVGDDVIFREDPDHVEWIEEIKPVAGHWQVVTAWCCGAVRNYRICDAVDLELHDSFRDPRRG